MLMTKSAHLILGIALGVSASFVLRSAVPVDAAPTATPASTAQVRLSGTAGNYLQFTGRETRPFTFRGSLAFRQPVTTGSYTLRLTLKTPSGKRTRLVYDIKARQR